MNVQKNFFYSLSDVSRILLMLLISFVLQGSSGSGGDCTPPSGATLSIVCREISEDACGADFPRRFVASSSFDSSGEILKMIRSTSQIEYDSGGWIETSLLVISASSIVFLRLFLWSRMLRCWLAVSWAFAVEKRYATLHKLYDKHSRLRTLRKVGWLSHKTWKLLVS